MELKGAYVADNLSCVIKSMGCSLFVIKQASKRVSYEVSS
jgi:hypothetical protein